MSLNGTTFYKHETGCLTLKLPVAQNDFFSIIELPMGIRSLKIIKFIN